MPRYESPYDGDISRCPRHMSGNRLLFFKN